MASAPSFATQKESTRAKVDSIAISNMVGMASSAMALLRLPCVKSCSTPERACLRMAPIARRRNFMLRAAWARGERVKSSAQLNYKNCGLHSRPGYDYVADVNPVMTAIGNVEFVFL